jgi:imidazolonepropionase-like amidohydrolase
MGNWMSSNSSIIFENVQLVGHPEGEYHVLVEDGIVKRISTSPIESAFEVVDCKDKWLAPVSSLRYKRAE